MLRDPAQLPAHPRYGASWEGFCIEQIVHLSECHDDEVFTWSVQGGEEIDLVLRKPTGTYGFEFKASDAPRKTPSLMASLASLDLTRVYIVYPGETDYSLDERIEVIALQNLGKAIAGISS